MPGVFVPPLPAADAAPLPAAVPPRPDWPAAPEPPPGARPAPPLMAPAPAPPLTAAAPALLAPTPAAARLPELPAGLAPGAPARLPLFAPAADGCRPEGRLMPAAPEETLLMPAAPFPAAPAPELGSPPLPATTAAPLTPEESDEQPATSIPNHANRLNQRRCIRHSKLVASTLAQCDPQASELPLPPRFKKMFSASKKSPALPCRSPPRRPRPRRSRRPSPDPPDTSRG